MIDKFYTPKALAIELVQSIEVVNPNLVVDPTCGSGNLLKAASNIFEDIQCVGMDKDLITIRRLKKEKPQWILSVADLQNDNSYRRTHAITAAGNCDLLLLNPPFSQISNQYVITNYKGQSVRSSVAMGFVLRSLELFTPESGALIIAPESMLYSELDEHARYIVNRDLKLEHLGDLDASTFYGTRARAVAIKVSNKSDNPISFCRFTDSSKKIPMKLIRGGMQMHKISRQVCSGKYRVIHSVDLKYLFKGLLSCSGFVQSLLRGGIEGKHILIPRVGIPNVKDMQIVVFESAVQLSDCVMSISTHNKDELPIVLEIIKSNEADFLNLYKGTGARYTTISRLSQWLSLKGMIIN
tara:strand:- start:52 stop:1113 length:1062 start_codon:yes stop_codon:yes gene_type:complete